MSSTSHNDEELCSQFRDVTGSNSERSRFFLEAAGWNLELALASFYEGGDQSDDEKLDLPEPVTVPGETSRSDQPTAPPPTSADLSYSRNPIAGRPVQTGGLGTLDMIRQREEAESSEDEEQGQAFFAGGSIASGQQVLGPSKKKDEFIKDLFEKARAHGATAEDPSTSSGNSRNSKSAFGGAGYKLGDHVGGSSQINLPTPSESEIEPQEVTLRLWSTGFTIDDGELRLYSDPNNLELLNSIKRGEIPKELTRRHPGHEVQLAMEDRRHEDYIPPKVPIRTFTGQGHVLGSPAPSVTTSVPVNDNDRTRNEDSAREEINISETEPTTNVLFRLADGSRLQGRFNHSHRISDLHNFINRARPQFESTGYTLTLFPNNDLTNLEATIKEANVLNSTLIQKIKSTG